MKAMKKPLSVAVTVIFEVLETVDRGGGQRGKRKRGTTFLASPTTKKASVSPEEEDEEGKGKPAMDNCLGRAVSSKRGRESSRLLSLAAREGRPCTAAPEGKGGFISSPSSKKDEEEKGKATMGDCLGRAASSKRGRKSDHLWSLVAHKGGFAQQLTKGREVLH
ncbi:uncharacterized protein LOC121969402 [Zingiber officinale]|uniref:uncharacterized protein LOC121969402 n=1 Tax=Zingiber officinale TaxID=94328 RepID=UPI001C4C85AF|nr:uncharacterized protein LOC121969402 [Zingiber officinale]